MEDPISEDILRGSYAGKTKIVVTIREAADEDGGTKKHLYFEGAGETSPAEPAPVTDGSPVAGA